ncbi:MAG: GNAT family N-acetyltransferase [Gaiellaceae bacterium]
MNVRRATEADQDVLHELWSEFERDVPEPYGEGEPWEAEWADTLEDIRAGGVFLADDDDGPVGFARIDAPRYGQAHVQIVYVRPRARKQGIAKALLAQCVAAAREGGATWVSLEVLTANQLAVSAWRRLGFVEYAYGMAAPLDALEQRLTSAPPAEMRGTTHAQTDDEQSVQRAIVQFIPRLESPEVRRNASWVRIADPVLDRDAEAHARFARELSERLGAVTIALTLEREVVRFRLYERGRMVDEYLSVPTYYGPLPKGDELALAANPTLVSRLTGADRDEVKRVARTASSPAELPPAEELYHDIARMMGVEP